MTSSCAASQRRHIGGGIPHPSDAPPPATVSGGTYYCAALRHNNKLLVAALLALAAELRSPPVGEFAATNYSTTFGGGIPPLTRRLLPAASNTADTLCRTDLWSVAVLAAGGWMRRSGEY